MKLNFPVALGLGAITLSLAFFQNCGSGGNLTRSGGSLSQASNGNNNNNLTYSAPVASDLNGIWIGPCEPQQSGAARFTLSFNPAGQVDAAVAIYSDVACLQVLAIDNYSASFVLGASSVAGSAGITFTTAFASRTPSSAAAATGFNTANLCGQMGWVNGAAKNISVNNSCLLMPQVSATIIGKSGTNLFFGNSTNSAIDGSVVYVKQ